MNLKFAFKGFLMPASILAMLSLASCSNDVVLDEDFAEQENTLTFSMRTPAGDKVSYSRADGVLHDAPEYAVNTLQLYEYEVFEEDTVRTSLPRILSYPTGIGKNVIDLNDGGDGSYSFSIVIPADYKNRKFTYRLVANNATTSVKTGESAIKFRNNWYSAVILKNTTVQPETPEGEDGEEVATPDPITVSPKGDALADPEKGIAMTGSAKVKGSDNDIIEFGKDEQKCDVQLTRIVSRIDIRYATPNLKLTKVELHGAPVKTFLFPRFDEENNPLYAQVETLKMDLSSIHTLPEKYLKDDDDNDIVELKKAFYLYERRNTEEDGAIIHLEYTVDANGTEYQGVLDVPFKRTSGDKAYIDTKRNHLYTIVLGNGDEPVSGRVSATLIVDDWNLVEIDEPITD
ncbi:MAG: hypothetical protein K2M29_04190 [Paramuribaculum sp.]|nr:hypothetical protein [Paramuribaculum sp.]